MTGHELVIALLDLKAGELNQEVHSEGCDCWGEVKAVTLTKNSDDEPVILLKRP